MKENGRQWWEVVELEMYLGQDKATIKRDLLSKHASGLNGKANHGPELRMAVAVESLSRLRVCVYVSDAAKRRRRIIISWHTRDLWYYDRRRERCVVFGAGEIIG